jgi:hypothetical protein
MLWNEATGSAGLEGLDVTIRMTRELRGRTG